MNGDFILALLTLVIVDLVCRKQTYDIKMWSLRQALSYMIITDDDNVGSELLYK